MSSDRVTAAALVLLAGGFGACATAQSAPPAADCRLSAEDSLVSVQSVDPRIRIDIRYATRHNFTGRRLPGYDAGVAVLRPEAARALSRVQAALRADGLGLKVWDAYRPVRATLAMVDWAERTGNEWVLERGYVARESGHNRGSTVDLTLVSLRNGEEMVMGTEYDHFSEASHTANAEGTVRENRQRLVRAMEAEGFINYDREWWHFTRPGPQRALDVPLGCFR